MQDTTYLEFVKKMLTFYSLLCQVDIHEVTKKVKQKTTNKIFIVLVNACYAGCLVGLSASVYHSYLYDLELHSFKKHYPTDSIGVPPKGEDLFNYTINKASRMKQVQLAWANARKYGKPYQRFVGFNEFAFVSTIICGLYNKLILTIYSRYWQPFRSDLIETLMSFREKEGHKIAGKITKTELIKLTNTSRKCMSMFKQQHHRDSMHHLLTHHIGPQMAANRWMPFNRQQEWLAVMCKILCSTCLTFSLFFGFFCLVLMFGAAQFSIFSKYGLETEPMDLFVMLQLGFFNVLSINCSTFYFSTTALTCIDQIMSSKRIAEEIVGCIAKNERIFTATGEADVMNRQVLSVFLDYRVFVSQTKLSLPQQEPTAFLTTLVILICPLIIYAHSPFQPKDLLILNSYLCIIVIILMSLCWLPFFLVQAYCHKLYQRLYSLMAHIARVQANRDIYSAHLIELLCKELSHPHTIVDQLTLKQLGLKLTARRFLSYLFWSGLVLIVANNQRNSDGNNNGIILALI